jgi:hypothetical protein
MRRHEGLLRRRFSSRRVAQVRHLILNLRARRRWFCEGGALLGVPSRIDTPISFRSRSFTRAICLQQYSFKPRSISPRRIY